MPDLPGSRRELLRQMAAVSSWGTLWGSAGSVLGLAACTPGRHRTIVVSLPTRSHLLTHVVQPVFGADAAPGRFAPGSSSGRFRALAPKAVVDDVVARTGDAAVAVLAGQGFVDAGSGQQLTLPVKRGGQILTGGSGEVAPGTQLLALVWNGPQVAILPYDPATGAPLIQPQWPDGLVGPQVREGDGSAGPGDSWQLAGLSDRDGGTIHVMVGVNADRADGLERLRGLGVTGPVIGLGNPGAAMLWQPGPGFQVLPGGSGSPATAGSPDPATAAPLPHYLAILSLA